MGEFNSSMLGTWSSAIGGSWQQGDVFFDAAAGSGGGSQSTPPTSHRIGGPPIRLEPFVYGEDDAYVLEFTHHMLRFYRGDDLVRNNDGNAYYVETPYDGNDLFNLVMYQSNDMMWIVSTDGKYSPRRLQRNLRPVYADE